MNIETEVKQIFRTGGTKEEKAKSISLFTNFQIEDILEALNGGGNRPEEIYMRLINLDRRK